MLSQMQFIVQYEDAVELPAGELVNMCKKLTFIRVTHIMDGSPVLLFDATLLACLHNIKKKRFLLEQKMVCFYPLYRYYN